MQCRIFQEQFCQAGKPVLVQNIQNKFFWNPDTLQRATQDLKGMFGKRNHNGAPKIKCKEIRPLTVSLLLLTQMVLPDLHMSEQHGSCYNFHQGSPCRGSKLK